MASSGCAGRECPCRMWINCHNYEDSYSKYYKSIIKEKDPFIEEYYETYFKKEDKLIDVIANG